MSLKHIPGCIWWPLGGLIVAVTFLIGVFAYMLVQAKQVDIKIAQLNVAVKYVDDYATQLIDISKTLQEDVQQLQAQNKTTSSVKNDSSMNIQRANGYTSPELMLKSKEEKLQNINKGLLRVQKFIPIENGSK